MYLTLTHILLWSHFYWHIHFLSAVFWAKLLMCLIFKKIENRLHNCNIDWSSWAHCQMCRLLYHMHLIKKELHDAHWICSTTFTSKLKQEYWWSSEFLKVEDLFTVTTQETGALYLDWIAIARLRTAIGTCCFLHIWIWRRMEVKIRCFMKAYFFVLKYEGDADMPIEICIHYWRIKTTTLHISTK